MWGEPRCGTVFVIFGVPFACGFKDNIVDRIWDSLENVHHVSRTENKWSAYDPSGGGKTRTHPSTIRSSNLSSLLQCGQSHCGCTALLSIHQVASKHWIWLHFEERIGRIIRMYESYFIKRKRSWSAFWHDVKVKNERTGSFRDMDAVPATISSSSSCFFLTTRAKQYISIAPSYQCLSS